MVVKTLEQATDDYVKYLENVMEEYIINLADDIVDNTRVDTGALKNNTNVSMDREDLNINRGADVSGSGAKGAARSSAKEYKFGKDIVITNGLPYAAVIENGSTKVSPNAFMSRGAEQFNSQMGKAVKKAK